MRRQLRVHRQTESALRVAKALKHAGCDPGWSTCRSTSRNRVTREQQEKGPDHPGARVAVKRQEQLGVSSQGAKDLPQGLAERTFASSDRTRRWMCLLRVTAQAQEEHKTPQQKQAPPDMQTGQSIRACLRRGVPADHEAHSRSGDSCEESQRLSFGGTAARRPKQGKARPWQRTTIAPHADAQSRLVQSGDMG